jgi:hypothetical protein
MPRRISRLSLILMTARRLGEGERVLRAGKWEGWGPVQMLGTHVTGKRLGIIGFGRIGKAIAKRCHFGFDMEVVFYNRSKVEDPGHARAPGGDGRGDGGGFRGGGRAGGQGHASPDQRQDLGNDEENRVSS